MGRRMRFCLLTLFFSCCVTASPQEAFETVHNSNAAILNRLGLAPLDIPDGHHKKRLVGPEPPELASLQTRLHQPYSRRHGHRDSHVYVVKLPASPPYYTITTPHKSSVKDDKLGNKITSKNAVSSSVLHQSPSLGFHSNGKPAKIYHWNLPVMKKIGEKKRLHAQFRMDQLRKKFEAEKMVADLIKSSHTSLNVPMKLLKHDDTKRFMANGLSMHNDQSAATKHTRNNDKILNYPDESRRVNAIVDNAKVNATHKMFRLEDTMLYHVAPKSNDRLATWSMSNDLHGMKTSGLQKPKKHRKKAAMSYYAPITTKTGSTSIHKNFPGNGKPKAFYVMEKSRKPVYYHPLLP